jgi:hypothetical protein
VVSTPCQRILKLVENNKNVCIFIMFPFFFAESAVIFPKIFLSQ